VPITTSVCEALSHPETFDGKLVEIHAKFSATWQGSWISDSECKHHLGELVSRDQHGLEKHYADVLRDVAKRYALGDVVRDKAWQEFDSASRRLYTGMETTSPDQPTKHYDYITADFTGVLVIKRNFRIENGFGNGWGHMGMSESLLVWKSVSRVSPHPL
jgi:hypothetical protein